MLRRKRHHRFLWFLLLCPCFLLLGSISPLQAEEISQEYQLKAAFLVNFARFISWPEPSSLPRREEFTLCIVGSNPFGTTLHALESKKINGRNLKVIDAETFQQLPSCHLLYVSKSEKNELESIFSRIRQKPVVTVSDIPGFAEAGGSIEFVTREDRLSFIINNSDLKQRGIQAGASMLDLAASVR